jgi:hypothetical protein
MPSNAPLTAENFPRKKETPIAAPHVASSGAGTGVRVGVREPLEVSDGVAPKEKDAVPVRVLEPVAVPLRVPVLVNAAVRETLEETVTVLESVGPGEPDAVAPDDVVPEPVEVVDAVPELENVMVPVPVRDALLVPVRELSGVCVSVLLPVSEASTDRVPEVDPLPVPEPEGEGVLPPLLVPLGVSVTEEDCVPESVDVPLMVPVRVPDSVAGRVTLLFLAALHDAVPDRVDDAVGLSVRAGEGGATPGSSVEEKSVTTQFDTLEEEEAAKPMKTPSQTAAADALQPMAAGTSTPRNRCTKLTGLLTGLAALRGSLVRRTRSVLASASYTASTWCSVFASHQFP